MQPELAVTQYVTARAAVVQDDISPEDKQMLQWITTAVKSNNFRFQHVSGKAPLRPNQVAAIVHCFTGQRLTLLENVDDPHVETEVTAGAFTIKLRYTWILTVC